MLDFPMEEQERTRWCWAAVAVSVARFYDLSTAWRQCSVVRAVLGTDCCENGTSGCNLPHRVVEPLCKVKHLHVRTVGRIAPDRVEHEIRLERPIACRVGWYGSDAGHFVVIHGFRRAGGHEFVRVKDPRGRHSTYPLDEFASAYLHGAGEWTHTYTTIIQGECDADSNAS